MKLLIVLLAAFTNTTSPARADQFGNVSCQAFARSSTWGALPGAYSNCYSCWRNNQKEGVSCHESCFRSEHECSVWLMDVNGASREFRAKADSKEAAENAARADCEGSTGSGSFCVAGASCHELDVDLGTRACY